MILRASVHDVRHFASLLRGVNFANRATMMITNTGITITVEEARTLLGTAYIFADIFDEFVYNPETCSSSPRESQRSQTSQVKEDQETTAFEIPLNTLIECLNIFGTAGPSGTHSNRHRKWKQDAGSGGEQDQAEDENAEDAEARRRRKGKGRAITTTENTTIDQYFSGSEKRTGMRMSYAGEGYPLTLIVAEDADGPTTTCEITTFHPDPHLDLPFDPSQTVLKIILKSSWLRDALSELDPSCDKLTFIGNPPPTAPSHSTGKSHNSMAAAKPMFRIHAQGTFGSTEMDYPNDRDVLETFDCFENISFTYHTIHITRALRALQSSIKTSLRIDSEGLLALQFLMPSPPAPMMNNYGGGQRTGKGQAFIEFRCLALEDAL